MSDVVGAWADTDSFQDTSTGTNTGDIDSLNGTPGTWIEKASLASETYAGTFNISGATTSSTAYREISGDTVKHDGTWAGKTCILSASGQVINIDEPYARMNWVSIYLDNATAGANQRGITVSSTSTSPGSRYTILEYIMVYHRDYSASSAGINNWGIAERDYADGGTVNNCVVMGGGWNDGFQCGSSPRDTAWNYCVAFDAIAGGFRDGVKKNCAAVTQGTDFITSRTGDTNNASGDASATGSNPVNSITSAEWNDSANGDFHLASDSTNLSAAGTSISVTTDIDEDTRDVSTPDIGIDEYVASGGATGSQINIADAWKEIAGMQINIGDAWKTVTGMQINIGDAWKTVTV